MHSSVIRHMLDIYYYQLQLLQKLQEGRSLVTKATEFMGERSEVDEVLNDVVLNLAEGTFEKMTGIAYDAGSLLEDLGEVRGHCSIPLPGSDKVRVVRV